MKASAPSSEHGSDRQGRTVIINCASALLPPTHVRSARGNLLTKTGMAIVLWIGIMMAAQSFEATPRHHAPAVVMGLLPGLGAWGVLMAKDGLRAGHAAFSPELVARMTETGNYIGGGFYLSRASSSRP